MHCHTPENPTQAPRRIIGIAVITQSPTQAHRRHCTPASNTPSSGAHCKTHREARVRGPQVAITPRLRNTATGIHNRAPQIMSQLQPRLMGVAPLERLRKAASPVSRQSQEWCTPLANWAPLPLPSDSCARISTMTCTVVHQQHP